MSGLCVPFLWCLWCTGVSPEAPGPDRSASDPALADVIFHDRLHQTFLFLNGVVIPAYLDHFRDEPDKLAVVHFYAGRLAETQKDAAGAFAHFQNSGGFASGRASQNKSPDNSEGASPQQWMNAARAVIAQDGRPKSELGYEPADILEHHLKNLGAQPHVVLQRQVVSEGPGTTASCPLYDPELLWAHRRLWEMKTKKDVTPEPAFIRESLAVAHAKISGMREQPENNELSLRKFLDIESHRQAVQELFWLYRCLGVEQERAPDATAARESLMRAWAIGDALFPVSERGRMERLDRVFLAELGDVYARLGRFDLMLRYMYSHEGLPGRFEMARPVAELTRVAESVRLAQQDESAADQLDEIMPETVSQILFDTPAAQQSAARAEPRFVVLFERRFHIDIGWLFIGLGVVLLLVASIWRIRRRMLQSRIVQVE